MFRYCEKLDYSDNSDQEEVHQDQELPFDHLIPTPSVAVATVKNPSGSQTPSSRNSVRMSRYSVRGQKTIIQLMSQSTKFQQLSTFDQWFNKIKVKFQPQNFVFDPDGNFKLAWDIFCMLLIFYEIIAIPLEISFDMEISYEWEICVDIAFFTDILMNFNTGYYENGVVCKEHDLILWNYMQRWFWIDLSASFPYNRVIEYELESREDANNPKANSSLLRLLSFTKLIRIIRLLRLAKLKRLMNKFEEVLQLSTTFAAIMSFLQLSFFVLFWSHWLGCIFHFVGQQEINAGAQSWLITKTLVDESWQVRYIASLYWAVVTMNTVGYGDLSPQTPTERLCGVFFLLVACGVFSFTMNTIGSALQSVADRKHENSTKMSKVTHWLQNIDISKQLQQNIKRYLSFVWDSKQPVNLKSLCATLSDTLREQVIIEVNGAILAYCPYLCTRFSRQLLIDITQILQEQTINPDEYLFTESAMRGQDRNLYFLAGGHVKLVLERNLQKLAVLRRGESFGLISFITGLDRTASAQSVSFADVFYIERESFLEVLRRHQTDFETFMNIRHQLIFNKDYSLLDIRCYSCQQDNHVIRDCPSLHCQIDLPLLIKVKSRCERLLRHQFVRSDPTYFHALVHRHVYEHPGRQIQQMALQIFDSEQLWNLDDPEPQTAEVHYDQLYQCGIVTSRFRDDKEEKRQLMHQMRLQHDKLYQVEESERQARVLHKKLLELMPESDVLNQLNFTVAKHFDRQKQQVRKLNKKHIKHGIKKLQHFVRDKERHEIEEQSKEPTPNHSESEDSNNSHLDHVVGYRFKKILNKYYAQKRYIMKQRSELNEQKQPKKFSKIADFDRVQSYAIFNPTCNVDQVVAEYQQIFYMQIQLRPSENVDYDIRDLVYDEIVKQYQINLDELKGISQIPSSRRRKNLNVHQELESQMNRQTKKANNLLHFPGLHKVKTTLHVLRALQSNHLHQKN